MTIFRLCFAFLWLVSACFVVTMAFVGGVSACFVVSFSAFGVCCFVLDHDYSLSYVLLSVLVSVGSFVCCALCFACCLFSCGVAVFVPLPPCLYPVFCPLTWGRCLGCGCGFAWFVGGFLGSCFCPAGVCTLVFVPCCWAVFA